MFTKLAILYSKNGCGWCESAKALMRGYSIPFEERKVDEDIAILEELREKIPGVRTVPQVFFTEDDGALTLVGGYEELRTYIGDDKD